MQEKLYLAIFNRVYSFLIHFECIFYSTVVPHKNLNCSQSSGANETMASPIGVCCEDEGNGEREEGGDGDEKSREVPGYSDLVTKHG